MWARLLAASALRCTPPSTSGRAVAAGLAASEQQARRASTRVRVRLTAPVDGLGAPGDAAAVRPGHARNYLIPQGLAVLDVPAGGRRRRRGPEEVRGEGGAQCVRSAGRGVGTRPTLLLDEILSRVRGRRRSGRSAASFVVSESSLFKAFISHHRLFFLSQKQGAAATTTASSPSTTTAASAADAAAADAAAAQRRLASVVRQLTRGEVVRCVE
jgi:hypothetical protein